MQKLDFSEGSLPSRWNSTGQVELMARGRSADLSRGQQGAAMLSQLKKKRGSSSQSPAQEPSSAKGLGEALLKYEVETMETPSESRPRGGAKDQDDIRILHLSIGRPAALNASSTPSQSTEKPKPQDLQPPIAALKWWT